MYTIMISTVSRFYLKVHFSFAKNCNDSLIFNGFSLIGDELSENSLAYYIGN